MSIHFLYSEFIFYIFIFYKLTRNATFSEGYNIDQFSGNRPLSAIRGLCGIHHILCFDVAVSRFIQDVCISGKKIDQYYIPQRS